MLEVLQMFLFLFKSKYRRKTNVLSQLCCLFVLVVAGCSLASACTNDTSSDSVPCSGNGECKAGKCACYDGWQGSQCQFCGGKIRLNAPFGTIHDGFGNYSVSVKCSWLIDAPNSTITLHLEEFATECGWDHLYVFDGDSVDSPLLAVFSGLMYKDKYSIRKIPEVVAESGTALVHFFSDDAFNMSGFNLTYRLNACPSRISGKNCTGNGICIDGVCTCDGQWGGAACHIEKCPDNCGAHEGRGHCEPKIGCKCNSGFKGHDCYQLEENGYWETIVPREFIPPGSASHGAAVWRDSMYIVGGESYFRGQMMYVYDFTGNVWETPHIKEGPSFRYAHSTVLYGDKLFLYGGVLGNRGPTAELWAFDVSAKTWENVIVKANHCNNNSNLPCGPLKSAGHTATIVTNESNRKADRMIVIFGHSPSLGFLNTVQEYNFGTREWNIVNTKGYPVKGGYGHTAAWDDLTRKIYVYGGIVSETEANQFLSPSLYSYDPDTRTWFRRADAPSARFLHSAVFISAGMMLVFGGNTHNDTSHSFGAKCYSADMLAYDVVCDTWQAIAIPKDMKSDLARFGHSAVVFENSMYLYGGFDGQMLSDILKYTPGSCAAFTKPASCLSIRPGVKCVWDMRMNKCVPIQTLPKTITIEFGGIIKSCPEIGRSVHTQNLIKCDKFNNCASCTQTTSECVWCGNSHCMHDQCKNSERSIKSYDQCPLDVEPVCRQLHTCQSCTVQPSCKWKFESAKCSSAVSNMSDSNEQPSCRQVCSEFTSCSNCTQEECIWCQNEGRCVDKNAYTASFPYGQCREWTTLTNRCRSKGDEERSQCSFYSTCDKCRDDPACGWCDDGSKTGLGKCMPGGYAGPTLHTHSLPSSTCPQDYWHFTTCPLCQCNGHAECMTNTSICKECDNYTKGPHCEECIDGYWGNSVNGGVCKPCECNGQASQCHPESGRCFCTTKGLAGDHCEKCDAMNHYHGDPTNQGSCYYDLTIDYQFTFNLSKKEDRHYTQINFRNSPTKPDIDTEFTILCSVNAKMNVTIKRANSKEEKAVFTNHTCSSFRHKFTKSEFSFGVEDNVTLTTFYVYVYDFQPPLWIQISFSQYPKLNLKQFFMTFSACFLILLLAAAILWKIKQRYDMYRRRQRLFVEMEQMASRPFSQVLVELEVKERLDADNTISVISDNKRRKRDSPSPIALEPCYGNRAAVLSLLVRLPTGGEPYTALGQSAGIAIASALVTLGNPRKISIDQVKTDSKTGKSRKSQSQHPDSCL